MLAYQLLSTNVKDEFWIDRQADRNSGPDAAAVSRDTMTSSMTSSHQPPLHHSDRQSWPHVNARRRRAAVKI